MATTPTTNLNGFLPLVRPHVPGAPSPAIGQALRKSCIEFCEKTRCWRDTMTATINRQQFPLVIPAYAAVHEIERAEFNGERLNPVEYDDIDLSDLDETGTPAWITQETPNNVSIIPFEEGTLKCTLVLKPKHGELYTLDADDSPENWYDTVPEFLLSSFGETIAAGAITRLMIIPGQPYTNPDLAAVHGMQFRDGIDRFIASNVRGQHRARPRVQAHWF